MKKIKKILSLVLISTIILGGSTYMGKSFAAEPLKDYSSNLVASYSFEETSGTTCTDTLGNNNGTYKATKSVTGTSGNAVEFDGVNSYIDFSSKIIPLGAKSVMFDIKTTTTASSLVVNNSGGQSATYGFSIGTNTSGGLNAALSRGKQGSYYLRLDSNTKINDGNWHSVLFTWDGTTNTDSAKLYIDGVLDISGTPQQTETKNSTYNFRIGRTNWDASTNGTYSFKGQLDELKIYNTAIELVEPVKGFSLDKSNLELSVDQTDTITATFTPTNATNQKVKWTIDDESIATISADGTICSVTGKKAGTTILKAISEDGSIEATCTITVKPVTTGRTLLTIYLSNETSRQYDLSVDELNAFLTWYDDRANQTGAERYAFDKAAKSAAFTKRTEYVAFDKIVAFDVDEYTSSGN